MSVASAATAAAPRVAVLVCCRNQREFLAECFESLRRQDYPRFQTYLLDNDSEDGSADFVEQAFPECTVLRLGGNLGFATANNRGLERAFADGADLCLLLNSDTVADPRMIAALVASHENSVASGEKTGLVQATVLLFAQPGRINTTGNALHYLGYGFCRDYLRPHEPGAGDRRILSASGAAVLVSRRYYEAVGGFDDAFFIYNEDQNLSWRGLLLGFVHRVSDEALVFHKYTFREHGFKMYHSEKNRLTMLLENYEARTLLVLAPMLVANEAMLLAHAALRGWLGAKLRSYAHVLRDLGRIRRRRRIIQQGRTIRDACLFPQMDAALDFPGYPGFIVTRVVSPLMRAYHRLARHLV
jgi:GT2 family glycosyltransferase